MKENKREKIIGSRPVKVKVYQIVLLIALFILFLFLVYLRYKFSR